MLHVTAVDSADSQAAENQADQLPNELLLEEARMPIALGAISAASAALAWSAGKATLAAVCAMLAAALAAVAVATAKYGEEEHVHWRLPRLLLGPHHYDEPVVRERLEKLLTREPLIDNTVDDEQEVQEPDDAEEEQLGGSYFAAVVGSVKLALFGVGSGSEQDESHSGDAQLPAPAASAQQPLASQQQPLLAVNSAAEAELVMSLDEVPLMSKANIFVSESTPNTSSKPASGDSGLTSLMHSENGKILAAIAQEGWVVEARDEANGEFSVFLPAVDYDFPLATVSIPSPHFHASVRDSDAWTAYLAALEKAKEERGAAPEAPEERLRARLVLQNGEDILTVRLGFPLHTTISVSAAGLAQARVGRTEDAAYLGADVDVGLKLPKIPGLTKVMQMFVKSYAAQSFQDCADALASGADKLAAKAGANEKAMLAVGMASAAAVATEAEALGGMVQAGRLLLQGAGEAALQASELVMQSGAEMAQVQEIAAM